MSLAGVISGPSSHNPPFFNDVHSLLQNYMGELTRLREAVEISNSEQQQVCDRLRKDIEQECHESRESLNKFRYEFDEMVHKRVETVLDGLDEVEQSQRFKDRHQQRQIDQVEAEVKLLGTNLGSVTKKWRRLKTKSVDAERIIGELVERQHTERVKNMDAAHGRGRSRLQMVHDYARRKAQLDQYELAEQVRSRLKGAAQFLRGEDWERCVREQKTAKRGHLNYQEFEAMCRSSLKLLEPDSSLKLIFDSLDSDGSEEVSVEELIAFVADPAQRMRGRLRKAAAANGNNWRKLLEEQDQDGSGKMSLAEFRRLCDYKLNLPETEYNLLSVFKAVDSDNSGDISTRELANWVEGKR